jgi:hypothetical protein
MMKRSHTHLCASAAIAAALALSTPPLLALAPTTVEPAPVPVLPEAAPPPAVQPTIVLPDIEPAPPPAEEPTAVAPPPTTRATAPARTERAAPARTQAPAPAPVAPEPVVGEEPVEPAVADVASEPVAPVTEAEPPPPAELAPAADQTLFWAAVLAGLIAVALAIWGFVAIGRRKPPAPVVERPVITPREPVSADPVATEAAAVTPLASPRPAPASSLAHSGAAVPLPRTMPESFAERDALINRMVAARPDRANPFTSPIQRRKRAKLILQSLGRDFGDREPWIDLSQYPQNWPELARRHNAAA